MCKHMPHNVIMTNYVQSLHTVNCDVKISPHGTDGRLLEWLSTTRDLDLDLRSGHTAYSCASVIDLYLHTKCH